ncbi:hypothetical protein GMST_00280 [Geomonas silvestris]|uniref:DUF2062 domain-containing protein n=1 Tax=Geomonas silvestris TaxID=2740184 RepID=A0A6V8MD18_9BACT|nr:DUF2062 domain-containing protein [Geomonas silvestris]GFO57703.1 hypothetical protein GMST_00280 [Geomonas silvestris]
MAGFFPRLALKTRRAVATVFSSGLTPHKLAQTLCLGAAVGMLPLIWGTSLICAGLATLMRLNQAAIQAVNYCCYPLQIALFLPLCRLGERILPYGPPLGREVLEAALHGNIGTSATLIVWGTFHGLAAWLVTVLPLALLIQAPLRRVLVRRQSSD